MPKPGFEPRQRQSAVSGGALDHTVSWQTPTWAPQWSTRYVYFGPKNSFSSYFYALKVEFILFSTSCAYFMTKRIVVLTIFILDHEKMTFFRWFWPHWFSPWPQNEPDLTFNLSSRSNCFWNTDAYKSLSLYNSNEGSFVAVCCICHILEQILLPPPHNSYLLQISNVLYTHNFRPLYKLNVQAIRLLTSRKWNREYGSLISWNWMSLFLVQILSLMKQRNRRTDKTEIDRSFTYKAHCTWWPLTFLPTS